MDRNYSCWVGLIVISGLLVGCGQPTSRLNAPPQGDAERKSDLQPFFAQMVSSEMLSDMSIADIHFVPHVDELNSLGVDRLSRIAPLVKQYGGMVRYATISAESELIDNRLERVREFLQSADVDMSRVEVAVALPGANHVPADEAIEAAKKGAEAGSSSAGGGQQLPPFVAQ